MAERAGIFGTVPQVPGTPLIGPDQSLNHIVLSNSTAGGVRTYAGCETTSNMESFDHREAFDLLSDELWLITSVALLILL